ncbi:MAG: hypothetical protein IPO27_02565 [Bacteroidetes bacterium]|nr:hypothetical protein [Bacteroidota bacterium]
MKVINLLIGCILLVLFNSCELINPEEPQPVYLHLDKFVLSTDYASQGTSSNALTDAWVYIDQQLAGAYEVPATVPLLLEDGPHEISIRGGIHVDGQVNLHDQYDYIDFFDTIQFFKKGEVTHIQPRVKYIDGAKFEYIEDFDDGGIDFTRDPNCDTIFSTTATNAFEGPYSAIAYLDTARPTLIATTKLSYPLSKSTVNMLELNYKSTNSFNVGLSRVKFTGAEEKVIYISLKPSETWNKIYINLSSIVSSSTDAVGFKLLFTAKLDEGNTSSTIMIDNIKLLHN